MLEKCGYFQLTCLNDYLEKKMVWLQKPEKVAVSETMKLLNQLQYEDKPDSIKNLTTNVISERRVSDEAQARLRWFLDANK